MNEAHDFKTDADTNKGGEGRLDPAPSLRAARSTVDETAAVATTFWFDLSVAVPFALDESGRRVLAAHRPNRDDPSRSYTCPFCDGAVALREQHAQHGILGGQGHGHWSTFRRRGSCPDF